MTTLQAVIQVPEYPDLANTTILTFMFFYRASHVLKHNK